MIILIKALIYKAFRVISGKIHPMNKVVETLPDEPEKLKELVLQLQDKINHLTDDLSIKDAKLNHQNDYINQLIEAIRLAKHQHFGTRSEKFNPESDQLSLLFNEAEALADHDRHKELSDQQDSETKVSGYTRKKSTGGRKPLPDHLPRIEVVHELTEDECRCDHCQGDLKEIGQKFSEQLELIPMTVRVIKHIKKTFCCPHCKQTIKAAKLPPQPIPGSMASAGTLAHVAINKYVNGMPLYRQELEFKRLEIPITRSSLANWMIKCGLLIQPLINLMRESMLSYDIVQMDETRCQVLKEPGKSPHSQSYMWIQRGGPPDGTVILYDYAPTRSQTVAVDLLGDYSGYLQTDGYEGYNKVCLQNGILQLGCWSHAKRKFEQAIAAQGKVKTKKVSLANQALQRIRLLYRIEKQARTMDAEQRLALRQSRSLPILRDLRKWLDQHLPVVVKQSALGKAMHYLDKKWEKLNIYTTDGRLNMDNNLCENAIRPFVIGRKNHLFSDTVSGAKASANLYSLIETAKANGLEPHQYLKTVFTELPKATCIKDIEVLLPVKLNIELDEAA